MQPMKMLGLSILGCHQALARLDDFLDRELSPAETRQVRFHLHICGKCARKFAWQRGYLSALRGRLEHLAPPSEVSAFKARLDLFIASEAARQREEEPDNEGEPGI